MIPQHLIRKKRDGEELEREVYARADRIAVVAVIAELR